MGSRHFSITEISALVHERYPSPPDAEGAKFTIPDIIGALLGMAQSDHFRVSFVRNSDTIFEHYLPNHRPYRSAEEAAVAAETHDDLQDKHYRIVRCGDGWGIRNVTAGHDDWRTYWEIKDEMKADGRRMTAEDYCELGDFILVSQDEWTGFVNSGIYRAWIKNNAPPTEGQVVRYWTDAPKAKPDGPTAEARSRGGSRSNHNQWLQEAIEHIIRELDGDGTPVTFPNVWGWVERNALPGENYEFIPPILGCDSPYVEGDKLYFKDQTGANNSMAKSSLKRYFTRAMKTRTQNN